MINDWSVGIFTEYTEMTGVVDTIFHGQSLITGKIARENDKNMSISSKLKYYLITGAHNIKLMCNATYCNVTTNTPCFSRFPIDLTWQPVSAWHHASFWNRKRRWRHSSVRIVNGPLTRHVNLRVAHAPGMFSPPTRVSDPDMHHGTCVTHVPQCMPGSLTSGFLWCGVSRKTFPACPAHAQTAIVLIW